MTTSERRTLTKTDVSGLGFLVRSVLVVLRHDSVGRNPNGLTAPSIAIAARAIGRTLDAPMREVNATLRFMRDQRLIRDWRPVVDGRRLSRHYRLTDHGRQTTKALDGMEFDPDTMLPFRCTGYYREDADYGDVLHHDVVPCPVHPVGCHLMCQVDGVHTGLPGCLIHQAAQS